MIPSDLRAHFSWIPTWNNHVGGSRFYQLTQKTTFFPSDQPNITACEPFVQFELDRRPGACHGTHVVPFFYECTSTVLRTKWYHSFTSGLHSDHIREVVPRSHQCGDLRHLSKCSAHFLQHCFRKNFYLVIVQWPPLAGSPQCPVGSLLFLDEHFIMFFQRCLPLVLGLQVTLTSKILSCKLFGTLSTHPSQSRFSVL